MVVEPVPARDRADAGPEPCAPHPPASGFFVGQYSTDIPLLSAASLIVIGPIVILYLIFQRNFVSGITQGAVKG